MKLILNKLKNKLAPEKVRVGVGLDIGSAAVKAVKLSFSGDRTELSDFAIYPVKLEPGSTLKEMLQSHPGIDEVNVAVSGTSTIVRYVEFPSMQGSELKQAMKYEAEKLIPFPMADVDIDTYILKQGLPDNKMQVLLAAAKKEAIKQRLKMLEDAGLSAGVMDMETIALVNAFNFSYSEEESVKKKTIAILNIGSSFSNLNIVDSGQPRLSRDIHIAGENFTQKISEVFSVSRLKAEELKVDPAALQTAGGEADGKKMVACVNSVLTNLATEVRTSFDYFESQNATSVEKIFLSGGGATFAGLDEMLSNLLGIAVEYWDPFRKVFIPENIGASQLKSQSRSFAVALGLALRG